MNLINQWKLNDVFSRIRHTRIGLYEIAQSSIVKKLYFKNPQIIFKENPKISWGFSYILIIFISALIYFLLWKSSSDNFFLNKELNIYPFQEEYLKEESKDLLEITNILKQTNEKIEEIERKIERKVENKEDKINELDEDRRFLKGLFTVKNNLTFIVEKAQIRLELKSTLEQEEKIRKKKLNFLDFLFYSIGISTTTTFGEIVANSRIVRSIVSFQLLSSVFVLFFFIDAIGSNNTSNKNNTSLINRQDKFDYNPRLSNTSIRIKYKREKTKCMIFTLIMITILGCIIYK